MAPASGSHRVILLLLAVGGAAWWMWGRGLNRNQLVAAGSALVAVWLLSRGAWQIAIPMFMPGIWMLVQQGAKDSPPARMDIEEARRVLGVEPGASVDEIRAAHRRLVTKVHPDQGGSAELAGKVNAARDILLGELVKR